MVEFQELLQAVKGKSITNNPVQQINLFNHGTLNDKFRRKETLIQNNQTGKWTNNNAKFEKLKGFK